jgi:4-alpha-glucanotransferase
MPDAIVALHELARIFGVLPYYLDMKGQRCNANDAAMLAILNALGANLETLADAPQSLAEKRLQIWNTVLEPTLVVWEDSVPSFDLRLPSALTSTPLAVHLTPENDPGIDFVINLPGSVLESIKLGRQSFSRLKCALPAKIRPGYYTLDLEAVGKVWRSLLICAPSRAYGPDAEQNKIWGAFLPLYALNTQRSWGAGDFSDLGELMRWVSQKGGNLVGTLPLLATFIPRRSAAAPYLPASKLFWNEFYLDVEALVESNDSRALASMLKSFQFQEALNSCRQASLVDYARVWDLKKQALAGLADAFFAAGGEERDDFQAFARSQPQVRDYARFRAAAEVRGPNWTRWPKRMASGQLGPGDVSPELTNLFLYAQWQTDRQMAGLQDLSTKEHVGLYLDVPLGVHPHSYDVWRERESFVRDIAVGAPPDPAFCSGQNWSFPPLHPRRIRQSGYRYLRACWRLQMKQTSMIRIDHQMGLHRLFWIPHGMETSHGLYVCYPAEELYAILALESQINHCTVVGEDLGIVPPEVRPAMEKHGVFRLFVGEYELVCGNNLAEIPAQSVASLNTHDMFPFASFWEEKDIAERRRLKLIDAAAADLELAERKAAKQILFAILRSQHPGLAYNDTAAVLAAFLQSLSLSRAYALLLNLEDLWLEIAPQNVPALVLRQNWSHKARYRLEELGGLPQLRSLLDMVNRARKDSAKA